MHGSRRKVVIVGGSGFLGLNLARALSKSAEFEACIISRHPPSNQGDWRRVRWDAQTLGAWADELDGAAAVVNLAGRSVDCIKTPDHCDEILRSRVEATRLIGRALRRIKQPPPVWVQMSTAHIYGDPPEIVCTEDSSFGYGLAPFVGKAWEDAYHSAVLPEMRQVILRTSFVLGRNGGALRRMELAVRLGLGGKIGSGKQGISWLHEEDMNRLFLRAIRDETMQGAYIATAPNPVSNAEFMKALRKALGAPIGLPSPAWMIKLAAPLILKTDPELALYGRYCVSMRLEAEGFQFKHPTLESALAAIYGRPST
ncbi:TIGR01777 family oxidoreductase [Caldilinea sp.]|uniref:TIGR01777 family oxidoreductase n=1 Tax=Caldilinea sp. TaxID=2293560 RepID=UPI0021DEB6E6|nr:TIGR01777 family oxidoreductase [Caldilinea sp.]GIV68145.1 MAG: epimerase [Caldilinea sp.]